MNKPGTKPDPNKVYKRDKKGQFAKVNSLLKKIAMAKAQGVPHVPPGPTKKVPPPFSALKNPAAKKLGHDLYMRKKAGEFSNDHSIYLAAAKLSSHYKKTHPSASAGMSANQIVNAYKRHEYDEVGYVTLLGQISGNLNQLDRTGPGSDWTPSGKPSAPSKPTIDKTKSGLSITSDKFPKPDMLKPTGQTLGGVTGVKVYVDSKGVEWAVKTPKTGSNAYGNKSFMVDIEIAASRLQNKAGLPVPAMHEEEVDGKHSAVSKMYKAPDGGKVAEAFPKGKGLDISVMTEQDIADMQRNQIFDWLISNHDTHSANFLRTENGIVGIDKGQAFKFFGKDKLDYNYQPVTPLDGNVSVYQSMWKQFAKGYGELLDPNGPELKGTIERIQNIPDEDYKKLLRPYATKAVASGSISMPNKPVGAGKAELVNHFLDEAVKRKNNLGKDFGDYYAKVKAEHDKNVTPPKAKLDPSASANVKVAAKTSVPKANPTVADLSDSKQFFQAQASFDELSVGDFVVDNGVGSNAPEYFKVTAKGKGQATFTSVDQVGYDFDIDGDDWDQSNWALMKPAGITPELNKPLKTVDGLKVGDKIEAPWGSVFTVTGFGSDGNGKYVETANAKGGFGGNIYNSTIAAAGPDNPFAFVGNVNDQGAVDLKDLAGQLVNDIGDVIPGDNLTVNINNHDVKVTVTSIENAPAAIYVKKASTGAIVVIKQGHFKEGKVKYAYARGGFKPENFKPATGANAFSVGDEVLAFDENDKPLVGKVVSVDQSTSSLDVQFHENDPLDIVTFDQFVENGKIYWTDNPVATMTEGITHNNTLGLVSEQSKSKPKSKIKIEGELAKDISNVEIGDVIQSQSLNDNENYKVIKLNAGYNGNGVEAINMSTGKTEMVFDYEFEKGYVSWGDQDAVSASAPIAAAAASAISSATQWPEYPEKDLVTGPFTNKNAPGTTLKSLNLPGWGGFTGELNAGDEIVGYGANGEFKKGSVVQSAGGPMNVYVSWDDDPSGDWVEFTHTGQGGFWGDGDINGVDSFTLVGKKAGATNGPGPQMPIGPHAATQASSIPTVSSPNKGKVATFDDLEVGVVYHVPGGKMQKVIFKDADSFQAQSVSGNKHTYPKQKFNDWAADKGVLLGMPGDEDPAPSLSEVSKDNVYMLPKDPFDPYGTETKYVVKSKTAKAVVLKDVSTGGEKTVDAKDWDTEAKGWKHIPGMSDWEKYSQGIITWEEYQETNGHKETAKLHSPEGPAAPGKPSPAESFKGKKVRTVEKKPPPPWSAIKGVHVKEMGAEVYGLKKSGSLTTDHELYLACGKVIRAWKKKYPNETNWPSNNQLRHAARRLEYEENGFVVWETEEQKTAQVIANVQTAKSAVYHVPTGKYAQDSAKMPLTSFGDSKQLAGSYQNPINFGVAYDVTASMAKWGSASNPQSGSHFNSGEIHAISWYTGSGAKDHINPFLRSGSVGYGNATKIQKAVKDMDSAIAKSNPVEDWTIVTRGAYGGYDIGINHSNSTIDEVRAQIGKTVLNKGYSSTSLGSKPAFGGSYRIIYRVPPGMKGLWVSGNGSGHKLSSCSSAEREFILPRNLKLKVVAANEHSDNLGYKFDVVVEIVGWEGQ